MYARQSICADCNGPITWIMGLRAEGAWVHRATATDWHPPVPIECNTHDGPWGADETCGRCTASDGSVRPVHGRV